MPARSACLNDGTFVVERARSPLQFAVYRYGIDGTVRDSSLLLDFNLSLGGFQILVESTVASFQDAILFGDPQDGSIQLNDRHGRVQRTLKLVGLHPLLIPDGIVPYVYPKFAPPGSVPAKIKHFPYFQQIRAAPDGTLWYSDFPRNKHEPIRWYGITRSGNRTGSFELDSSVVLNQSVSLEDFDTFKVLLRIEPEARGSFFRIVPIADLQTPGSGKRN